MKKYNSHFYDDVDKALEDCNNHQDWNVINIYRTGWREEVGVVYYIRTDALKQQWSEEDECCRKQLITFCENCMVQDSNSKKCADWLKSLKDRVQPQPKQEWSKEDNTFVIHTRKYLDDAKKCIDYSDEQKIEISKCMDWVRTLLPQPHWKPSLAQLNALSIVSKGNTTDDIEAIVSLYNDLKKLKGEQV